MSERCKDCGFYDCECWPGLGEPIAYVEPVDRQRERLEAREIAVGDRTVSVTGWRWPAIWTEQSIAPEHVHLIAAGGTRYTVWTASQCQRAGNRHHDCATDHLSTPRYRYVLGEVRTPKYVQQAFDLYLDGLRCSHDPARVYAWTARDDTAPSGRVMCAACCECGKVLAGGV